MIQVHKSSQRGVANHGWLQSNHTFSFGHYYDPQQMGFGPLRVINEDRVQPAQGFGTHGHQDMEIITYVLSGALEHKDSLGTGSVIRYGDVQRMSAGTGVRHSEFNHSQDERVHFLQIWIEPNVTGIAPSYEERNFSKSSKTGRLRLIASPDGEDESVLVHQDARLYAAILKGNDQVAHTLAEKRLGYVHVIRGRIEVNGELLNTGDALKLTDEREMVFKHAPEHEEDSELLLFDLPELPLQA